ncbi:MAG: DUF871 domain-containing protein [Clostridiales bacterium]|nr:DUF871 domain-containing protein [Clostridiales bacterium]
MKTGLSFYFSSGLEKNKEILQKAIAHKAQYLFTSLHIPEEEGIEYRQAISEILEICREGNLKLIVDVGPETLDKLGVSTVEALEPLGIEYIRLDYGFSAQETVALSHKFNVVFNASTITEHEIDEWREAGADFRRFAACHNYYPKQHSGLSIQRVMEINLRLKALGFTTMAFIPGDLMMRGPLGEGLPTVEKHRLQKDEVALNMLELFRDGMCDIVMVGDVDLTDRSWHAFSCLSDDYVELRAQISPEYEFVRDIIHHDRPDSSDMIFRSQESRFYKMEIPPETQKEGHSSTVSITGWNQADRQGGSISISNQKYLRYMGELEIARVNLPGDERMNHIGEIHEEDRKYLPYIRNGLGIKLIPS